MHARSGCRLTTPPMCYAAIINPRRACAARVISTSAAAPEIYPPCVVRPSVCLSVTTFSATTRNETTKQRYQRVHRYTYNCCVQKLWQVNKPICKLAQAPPRPLALCILKAQGVTTKGMYRLPHAIYYCS